MTGAGQAKIAAAPISWGVCEVPGWGFQLTPQRVLTEMAELGFSATEFGPVGFLPDEPARKAELLGGFGLTATGGFVPVVLHDPRHDPVPEVQAELAAYGPSGASVLVLAAATGVEGYDSRPELDAVGWATLLTNLDRLQGAAQDAGVTAVLHPHVGTMVETSADLGRVLAGSGIPLCLDTGHLLIGGTDPVTFTAEHADRIAHAHLKDVDVILARTVQSGERSYYDAVIAGLYRPLGQGDIDVRSILASLRSAGYDGWFVLEQDNVLGGEPEPGAGPIDDARTSADYLRATLAELA
ncbi:sugar phosphate isomerase/epimerase [Humibacter antri]